MTETKADLFHPRTERGVSAKPLAAPLPAVKTPWADGFWPERVADPATAYADARQAHAWVSRELATAGPRSIREFCLTQERKRLADIAWRLKRLMDGYR